VRGDEEVGKVNGGHKVMEFWTNRANKEEKEERRKLQNGKVTNTIFLLLHI
jgi:hypothetical protein